MVRLRGNVIIVGNDPLRIDQYGLKMLRNKMLMKLRSG